MEPRYRLNVDQVRAYLPHRHPFLLVDQIQQIVPSGNVNSITPAQAVGIEVIGKKAVAYNEPWFQGHFPAFSIMPGVLVLESMAQTASFSLYPYVEKDLERFTRTFQCMLIGADQVRFRRPIVPGDCMTIESRVTKCRGKIWVFECQVSVDGQKAAEAEIIANMVVEDQIWSKGEL